MNARASAAGGALETGRVYDRYDRAHAREPAHDDARAPRQGHCARARPPRPQRGRRAKERWTTRRYGWT